MPTFITGTFILLLFFAVLIGQTQEESGEPVDSRFNPSLDVEFDCGTPYC